MRKAPTPAGAVLILLGVALVVLYHVLKATGTGGIGAPSDIGGGGILLAGYVCVAVGLILWVRALIRRRRSR